MVDYNQLRFRIKQNELYYRAFNSHSRRAIIAQLNKQIYISDDNIHRQFVDYLLPRTRSTDIRNGFLCGAASR